MNSPTVNEVFDYAIVGAGIAGASIAWRAAAHGKVLLLEQESQPGYHSTGRSGAMFMSSYGTQAVRALTRASRAFYEQPPSGFAEHPLLMPRGVIYVAGPEDQLLLDETFDKLSSTAQNVTRVSAAEILRRVPVMKPDMVLGGILESGAMDMDVHGLHQGFLREMRRCGGKLCTNAKVVAGVRRDGLWHLTLANGQIVHAGNIVNAAGAWVDELAIACGIGPIDVQPRRRAVFTFDGPTDVDFYDWPVICGIRENYYFKPDAGQLLGSPANADLAVPHDVAPEELDIATGIFNIEAVTKLKINRPRHVWAGLRSFVHDGDLVIGWDCSCDSFFWLAAQGGYGIQTVAAASELAMALMLRQSVPERLVMHGVDPSALSPARLSRTAFSLHS